MTIARVSWQPQREQQFISIRYFSLVHPMLSFVLVIPEFFRLDSFVSPRLLRTGATAPPICPLLVTPLKVRKRIAASLAAYGAKAGIDRWSE